MISNLEQLALIIKEISFELRRNKYLTFILMFFPLYLFLVFLKKFKSVVFFVRNINKDQLNMLEMYSYVICSKWKAVTKKYILQLFLSNF